MLRITIYGEAIKNDVQHNLSINCGSQFAFSKEAFMIYVTVLSDMITKSLLLIKI